MTDMRRLLSERINTKADAAQPCISLKDNPENVGFK